MTDLCGRCGAVPGGRHAWVEGDCVLDHRTHAKATIGWCCQPCVDRWSDWLAEIVRLFDDLPRVVPLGSVPDDTAHHSHVRRRSVSPALMRLDPWSMYYDRGRLYYTGNRSDLPDVPSVLSDLAARLHESLGAVPPRIFGDDLAASAAYLTTHTADLAVRDWVLDANADLRWVRRHLRRAHGIAEPRALGHCLSVMDGRDCGGMVWPSDDPAERPRCDRCGRRYGPLDLVRLKMMEGTP